MVARSSNTTQRRSIRPPANRSTRAVSACVVVIHGEGLGQRLELGEQAIVIGRSPDAELQINHRSISRQHCRIWRDATGYRVRDLDSTNKTFLNEQLVDEAELRDGDHIGVGDSVLKFMEQGSIEARYHEELYQLATSDPLTGLYNRRQFQELMEKEILRATRHARALSLALVDIDHFKPINDRHGHPAGDGVIRGIAQLLRHNARADQLIARIGGEEFALVYAEQSLAEATAAAERLRKAIAASPFDLGGAPAAVTVSIGVAQWQRGMSSLADLMRVADEQLYRAKKEGRNRVCRVVDAVA
ncbi:diguanylate cyclase (GGDEF)-like protein [Tahibacter aquaticus]|uniref:diguanylate cyclase n=1 Tax=Tahibacter aquaticus TaxID=520092 RepID=A0A4R6YSR3_9GAMM|nr:GGDEF domain-containing protein [Tahibacter aquaticus]TDR41243.1 diguanylate cyclase (GGDEF)-like protein [Tahibacter aquaticus]